MKKLLITILTFSACLHSTYADSSDSVSRLRLPEKVLESAEIPEGDTVFRFQESVQTAYYRKGRIITVSDNGQERLNVLDIETGDTTLCTLEYGADGNRLLAVFPRKYKDTLVFADPVRQLIIFFNMDSLAEAENYGPEAKKVTMDKTAPFPTIIPYPGGRLLGLNPYCFKTKDGRFDNGDDRRFIVSDADMVFPGFGKYQYYTLNVAQGTVLANPSMDRLIFLHHKIDIMEIYEYSSLKKLCEISGPADVTNDFGDFNNGIIAIFGHQNSAYLGAADRSDWFIAAFRSQGTTYLLKTDWNGKLIKTYSIGNNVPQSLSLSEDGEYLYSSQYTSGNRQVLVRYKL